MKRMILALSTTAVFISGLFFAVEAGNGRGMNSDRAWRNYDPATVEKITGTVEKTGTYDRGGVHVTLSTPSGKIDIHLGPDFYVNDKVTLKKGDIITVTGSRVKYNGADVIIARSVEKDGKTVELRHEDGTPYWQGHGHHR